MSDYSFGWIVLLLFLYLATSPNWGKTKHTVYEVSCADFISSLSDCPDKLLSPKKTTYLAIPETQTIIGKSGILWRYEDCTVFDAENWTCNTLKYDSLSWDKLMENGHYSDLSDSIEEPKKRTTLRIEYIIRKIISFTGM